MSLYSFGCSYRCALVYIIFSFGCPAVCSVNTCQTLVWAVQGFLYLVASIRRNKRRKVLLSLKRQAVDRPQ
ncbi:hypothetical protein C8Q79DRAFT_943902 [Trametes meyenii]|nr:hypothetical protein C8Q79DRAFT_943902 [Trametes meyenii]